MLFKALVSHFFNGNSATDNFSKKFFSLCPLPCHTVSNDTDLKSMGCPEAESIEGQTDRQTE
jgi:hypothetical protein